MQLKVFNSVFDVGFGY